MNEWKAKMEAEKAAIIKELIAERNASHDEQLVSDMIEGETSFFEVLSSCVNAAQNSEMMESLVQERIKALQERKKRFTKRADAQRKLIADLMTIADCRKAELPEATLSIGASRPKVVIVDEESIPDEFWKVSRSIDKTAIAQALKESSGVAGAVLSNGGEQLNIRSK